MKNKNNPKNWCDNPNVPLEFICNDSMFFYKTGRIFDLELMPPSRKNKDTSFLAKNSISKIRFQTGIFRILPY